MSYLIDTNVLSEIRKGERAHKALRAWWNSTNDEEMHISVLTIAEIRHGIEKIRSKQAQKALALENWMYGIISHHSDRMIQVDLRTAEIWGRMGIKRTVPMVDSLLAATAVRNDLTLVTRNTKDMEDLGVKLLNPFKPPT